MPNKLEERLKEFEKNSPIKNDDQLAEALRIIIKEETANITENNIDLISDATALLMDIEGISEESANRASEQLLTDFMEENRSEAFSAKKTKIGGGLGFTVMRKVAVFTVLIISAAVILAGFNGEVRASVKNTFVTWMRELAIIDFTKETAAETEKESEDELWAYIKAVSVENVPEGFVLESTQMDGRSILYTYKKGDDFVVLNVLPSDPSGIIHSTEKHKYSELLIGDTAGYMFYSEDDRSGSVIFGNSEITVIVGGVAEREVLIDFASEIEW